MDTPHISYLTVDCPPTIAVDSGSTWTGGVARDGREALDGFVVGLIPGRTLTDADRGGLDLDDFDAWRGYYDRVYEAVEVLWERAFDDADTVRLVFEEFTIPRRPSSRTTRRVPLVDWLVPRTINEGLSARFPGSQGVLGRSGFGGRHQPDKGGTGQWSDYYPSELYRKRPAEWMPNDHPRNVRNHEQSAYDAAGAAHLLSTGQADYDDHGRLRLLSEAAS